MIRTEQSFERALMATQSATGLVKRAAMPSIGLVLGGGGARGLAHILMLEAFDELGLRPKIIAGTSIGAIFGAAYASGLSAPEIRAHTEEVLTGSASISARSARGAGAIGDPVLERAHGEERAARPRRRSRYRPAAPGGARFRRPRDPVADRRRDFYGLEPTIIASGPLRRAVAASMALPVIFEPVIMGGRTMIDGGLTNPLPFDILEGEADILVAIDVSGVTVRSAKRAHPTAIESLFAASFLFERSIVREKLKYRQPDIYIDAGTGRFQVLDFLKVREILAAALPAKEKLKAQLARVLGAETSPLSSRPIPCRVSSSRPHRSQRPRRRTRNRAAPC